MFDAVWLSRILFALGVAGLGGLSIAHADFVLNLEPVPETFPLRAYLPYLSGAVLALGGFALVVTRVARLGASVLSVWFLLWIAALHTPRIDAFDAGILLAPAEAAGMFAGALALAGLLNPAGSHLPELGRYILGLACLVFGWAHFAFAQFTADFIPSFIPAHLFFAYFTGAAHIAGGLSLLTGIVKRLGATLLGAMYFCFFALVHIPRVLADMANRQEWTSLCVNLVLTASAFAIAGALFRQHKALQTGAT